MHILVLPPCRDAATGTNRDRQAEKEEEEEGSSTAPNIQAYRFDMTLLGRLLVSGFKHRTANRVSPRAARGGGLLHTY